MRGVFLSVLTKRSNVCSPYHECAHTGARWRARRHGSGLGNSASARKRHPQNNTFPRPNRFWSGSSPFLIPMVLPMINYNSRHLINALLSTAPRWHSLELHDYFSDEFLQMLPNTLTNLTRLDIKIQRPADYVTAVKVFLSAPRLRQVNLAVRNTAHFPMPWAQLTHLTLSEASPQLSLDILLQCTSVIHAMLWKVNPWAVEPDAAPLVTLPQLKKLEVHFAEDVGDAVHITPFFARLDLPALEDLDMHAGWQNTWSLADFTQFQRRSPNLERLAINASHLEPDDLIDILLVAPNLVDLVLEMCPNCIDDSVLDLLQYTEQAAPMAPRLDSIYAGELETDLSEGIMQKMVKFALVVRCAAGRLVSTASGCAVEKTVHLENGRWAVQ
ncbi:hypothetical protein DFH06DRAFT_1484600 [Mycena polygramma]|nr:hypothetical protein DFH06DRAFT_1484600 [Mycena polygramma]